jgi:hypothetical protein
VNPATTIPLPEKPSLDQLRTQARELQRAARAGEPRALALVDAHHPGAVAATLPLSAAQLVLARRHGFPSWPRLVAHLAVVTEHQRVHTQLAEGADPASVFLDLACLGWTDADGPHRWAAARQVLAAHPDIAGAGIAVAAARADVGRIAAFLAADATLARAEGGPQRWQPLLHLGYARHDPDVPREDVLAAARLLLDHGADPNAGYLFQGLPTPFTVLTGVLGGGERAQPPHPHALALAELLLAAGADPNDGQALYNRMFTPDDSHLTLLLAHGLGTGDGGPWHARMPDATEAPAEMLRGQLVWAATHGYADRVRLLAAHGVDLCTPLPGLGRGRTAVELAAAAGRPETVALFVELGCPAPAADSVDALVAAALAGDAPAVRRLRAAHPEALDAARSAHPGLIVRVAAAAARRDAIRLLVELGFPVDGLGRADLPIDQPWETALHHAAAQGDDDMVEQLLRLGADPTIPDARFGGTAADWARHFGHDALAARLDAARGPFS